MLNTLRQYSDSDRASVGLRSVLKLAELSTMVAEPAAWFAEKLAGSIWDNQHLGPRISCEGQ